MQDNFITPPNLPPQPNPNFNLPEPTVGPTLGQKILSAFLLASAIMGAGTLLAYFNLTGGINSGLGFFSYVFFLGVVFSGHGGGQSFFIPLVTFGVVFALCLIGVFSVNKAFGPKATKLMALMAIIGLAANIWVVSSTIFRQREELRAAQYEHDKFVQGLEKVQESYDRKANAQAQLYANEKINFDQSDSLRQKGFVVPPPMKEIITYSSSYSEEKTFPGLFSPTMEVYPIKYYKGLNAIRIVVTDVLPLSTDANDKPCCGGFINYDIIEYQPTSGAASSTIEGIFSYQVIENYPYIKRLKKNNNEFIIGVQKSNKWRPGQDLDKDVQTLLEWLK